MSAMESQASAPLIEDIESPQISSDEPQAQTPRIYKKKRATIAGWLQIICGVLSIWCGIVILCVIADEYSSPVQGVLTSWPTWAGVIYGASGILGVATTRRQGNHCLIIGYIAIAIFSSFIAVLQYLSSIIVCVIIMKSYCRRDILQPFCNLSEINQLILKIVYGSSCVVGFVHFLAAVWGSSLACHVAGCNSTHTPTGILHNEDESNVSTSSDSPGSSILQNEEDESHLDSSHGSSGVVSHLPAIPEANSEDTNASDGWTYPIIPHAELVKIKQIGQGGYGDVYLAKLNNLDVAAKRLHEADEEECRREAGFLSRLDHPNIVKLIGIVDEKFDFYLVLELCDGGSLRSYLDDHKDQPLGLTFYDFAKQAARPIKYLNEKKIVHKDIKSPNYLLASSGALKLGDFGLAKNVDLTIKEATERASYPWMAPELLRDHILSPKYDVFAYAIVLWELWTRQKPFEDVFISVSLVWRICNNNERPAIPTDCPKSVADLMRLCWETDWKMRPNMEEVLSQLASAEEEAMANIST